MSEEREKPVELGSALTRQTIRFFWSEVRKHKLPFFVIWIGLAALVVLMTWEPFVFRRMFDILNTRPDGWIASLDTAFYTIVFIELTYWGVWRVLGFTNAVFQPRVISDLLLMCYAYMLHHSQSFFANTFLGSVVSRIRRFAYAFEAIDDLMKWSLGRTTMTCIGLLIASLIFKPMIGAIYLIWAILFVGFAVWSSKFKMPHDLRTANQDTKVTAQSADTLSNVINVQRFGAVAKEIEAMKQTTDQLCRYRQKSWSLGQTFEAIQGLTMIVLLLGIVRLCIFKVSAGEYSLGDFVAINTLLGEFFYHLWDLGRNIRSLYERFADANEMTEMLEIPHEIVDAEDAKPLIVTKGCVEFKDINFNYGADGDVFSDFNLQVVAGQRIALVGKSGAGKTTLIKLLMRKLNLIDGQILIDGQDIRNVTLTSLRRSIALVPQDPTLFHMSILENIRYARPDATDEEVLVATRAAHCEEFVMKLELGYNTVVGERGLKLSGGQRQRVAIAQAFLQNAPIIVLDEATSSLDSESEYFIQVSLKALMKDRTTFVIAHRLSTIKEMDRILVLSSDGQIVEQGTHDELALKEGGHYSQLWERQAGGFIKSISA